MKKRIRIFTLCALMVLLSFAFASASFAENEATNITDAPLTVGRSFSESEGLHISSDLKAMPKTYEAVVYVPEGETVAGTIFGNYLNLTTPSFNFLINSSGKPYLHITDQEGNQLKKAFNYDIRGEKWAHIVITHTVTENGSSFVCYVNGESVATASYSVKYELDMKALQHAVTPYLGQDLRPTYNFKGRIKNVALYSEPLTADQVKASYNNGIDTTLSSLMACYDLTNSEGESKISDLSGNGYDVKPVFFERDYEQTDYDFSFAAVGDTQFLADYDVYNGTEYYSKIYDWLVKNKDSKKIARVFGVGDITENNGVDRTPDDGIDQTDDEWELAVANFQKLETAGIPYSITWGKGHDTVAKFNEYFSKRSNFTDTDTTCYSEGSLENYYTRFEVGQTKYMVMSLGFTPEAAILEWAGNAIKENSEYRVIIITHYYLELNAEIAEDAYSIWENVIDKNSNVVMVLSGHVNYPSNIIRCESVGTSGHTVNQFLINPQYMDKIYGYNSTGMVAMFYFSNDGRDVRVEYISTVKTLEAEESDSNAEDILYASKNQFSFNIPKAPETITTVYGEIPEEYADVDEYPFVLFDEKGEFIGAAPYFYGAKANDSAIALAKTKLSENVWNGTSYSENEIKITILMRRDFVMSSNETYNNNSQIQGSLIIDLGGYKLTAPDNNYLFPSELKAWTGSGDAAIYPTEITLKNGDVSICNKSLIRFTPNANALGKKFVYLFEDVDFFVTGTTSEFAITHTASGNVELYPEAHFVDCDIDITGAAAENINLFNLGNKNTNAIVTVSGGTVKANASGYSIASKDSGKGSLLFNSSEESGYTVFNLPIGTTAESINYEFNDGKLGLLNESSDSVAIYGLAEKTKYGLIPSAYADSEVYTILLFNNGVCVGGYNDMGGNSGAIAAAKTLTDGNISGEIGSEVQILLRNNALSKSRYSNTGQSQGTIIIDLNGYTLTQTNSDYPLLHTQAKNYKGTADVTFKVFGGNIVLKAELLVFGAYHASGSYIPSGGSYKTFIADFTNVNFAYVAGSSAENFLGKFNEEITSGERVGYDVTFTDCTFDFNNATSMTCIMNANDEDKTDAVCTVSVKVNGCEISSTASLPALYDTTEGSSVLFDVGSNGTYLLWEVDRNEDVPTPFANSGELEFVKIAENKLTAFYRLRSILVKEYNFVPKMSLTLDRNLIMNTYIPANNLQKFTFDGVTYDDLALIADKKVTLDDGNDYYLVTVSLDAKEAAKTVKLIATVDIEGKSATATFTFSIPKYAEKIIDSGSETEVTLIKDVLAYIKSAYTYFGTNDSEALSKINALLGDYSAKPTVEGDSLASVTGFKSVTFILDGTPSMRFYLADGANAENYAFYVGTKKVATEVSADGTYVDIDVYAYALCETVSVKIGGNAAGSFHINAYYAFVSGTGENSYAGEDKEALTALTECFWKYLQSARAYRESVIEG